MTAEGGPRPIPDSLLEEHARARRDYFDTVHKIAALTGKSVPRVIADDFMHEIEQSLTPRTEIGEDQVKKEQEPTVLSVTNAYGDTLSLDPEQYLGISSLRPGRVVQFTPTQGHLLAALMTHPNRMIPYRVLTKDSLGYNNEIPEDKISLKDHISRLRRKIGDEDVENPNNKGPWATFRFINAVRGLGYMLNAQSQPPPPEVLEFLFARAFIHRER